MPQKQTNQDHLYPEIEARLSRIRLYKEFQRKSSADSYYSSMHSTLLDAVYYAYQRSKLIIDYMPQYTLHDGDHLFRVCELMGYLIDDDDMDRLSSPDLYVLILCGFFHDLGMAPSKKEVEAWRTQLLQNFVPKHSNKTSIITYIHARPDDLAKIKELQDSQKKDVFDELRRLEDSVITDFIRETHAARTKQIISEHWSDKFRYRDVDLTPFVSLICESHTHDALSISSTLPAIKPCGGNLSFCPQYCAVLLRLADLLDFDMKRAPKPLLDVLNIDNSISMQEWSKHRSIDSWNVTPRKLEFSATCDHPIIQDALYDFCSQIDEELRKCSALLSNLPSSAKNYRMNLPSRVDSTFIQPRLNPLGKPVYTYKKTRFTLDQDKVVDLLMGTSLYGNPSVALRELLQNSIDACLARRAFENAWKRSFEPKTEIIIDRSVFPHTLSVVDCGIGMDMNIINNFYAKVGSCYYKSPEFYKVLAKEGINFKSISRFGIGVLSYFLVANRIEVSSCRIIAKNSSAPPVSVKIDGVSGIFWIADGELEDVGTNTKLLLLKGHPWENKSSSQIRDEIEEILPRPPYKIDIFIDGDEYEHTGSSTDRSNLPQLDHQVALKYPKVKSVIKTEAVYFSDKINGYEIEAKISWLDQHSQPVKRFKFVDEKVFVESNKQRLSVINSIESRSNRITQLTTSLHYRGDKIETNEAYLNFMKSRIELSLHGFDVPFNPFEYGESTSNNGLRNVCHLNFPFHVSGKINVESPGDLSLNAARDNVIPDRGWFLLRNWVIRIIIQNLKTKLSDKYYRSLLEMWFEEADDIWVRDVINSFNSR